jgi:hypothetical protein
MYSWQWTGSEDMAIGQKVKQFIDSRGGVVTVRNCSGYYPVLLIAQRVNATRREVRRYLLTRAVKNQLRLIFDHQREIVEIHSLKGETLPSSSKSFDVHLGRYAPNSPEARAKALHILRETQASMKGQLRLKRDDIVTLLANNMDCTPDQARVVLATLTNTGAITLGRGRSPQTTINEPAVSAPSPQSKPRPEPMFSDSSGRASSKTVEERLLEVIVLLEEKIEELKEAVAKKDTRITELEAEVASLTDAKNNLMRRLRPSSVVAETLAKYNK